MAAKVWSRVGGDPNWSNPANWNGGTVPVTTDTITFDGTSVLDCTIDNLGTWSGGTFTTTGSYTGTINQNVAMVTSTFTVHVGRLIYNMNANLTTAGFFISNGGDQTGGFVRTAGNFQATTLSCDGDMDLSGAGTVLFTGQMDFGTTDPSPTYHFVCPPGIMEVRGSMIIDSLFFMSMDANGGTVLLSGTASQTIQLNTNCGWNFNLVDTNKSAGNVTITSGTVVPLGTNPTGSAGLIVNGEMSWTGAFAHVGALTVNNGGIISGAPTSISLNLDITVNAGATWPSGISVNLNGSDTQDVDIPGRTLGTCSINKTAGTTTIVLGTTFPFGTDPTISMGTAILAVGGKITATGTVTTGANISFGAGAEVSGNMTIVMTGSGADWTMNAAGIVTGSVSVEFAFGTGTARFFAGGGKTYAWLIRSGAANGALTIFDTNTFTGGIIDNQGSVAHAIVFPNVTTTVGDFLVRGSSGKLVTLARTGGSGTFTLTKTGGGRIDDVDWISVSNSTVDASPAWYAGANSTNGGGNTNWIFTAAPGNSKSRRRGFMVAA